jgi:hypothetical protein
MLAACIIAIGIGIVGAGATVADEPEAASDHLDLVGSVDVQGAMSLAFSSRTPHAYVHSRAGGGRLTVLDVTDPEQPKVRGSVDVRSAPYMEDMQHGERSDGTVFVLVRADSELWVIDVTNPHRPTKRSAVAAGTHTWECVNPACTHAYATAGPGTELLRFSIVDLTDLDAPRVVGDHPSTVANIHDWYRDGAGVMWAVGVNGIAAYDATDPVAPVLVNHSDVHGVKHPANPYNDRLHFHGAERPFTEAFTPGAAPAFGAGNVLFVSEEGDNADCTDSFQAWHVPSLAAPAPIDALGLGTLTPISHWSLLDADPATLPLDPAFCSVHWFDVRDDGFVALPTYANGTRVLDVRDPAAMRQVAFHHTPDAMAIQSYWVPERRPNGRTTGRDTDLIYTADVGPVVNPFAPDPLPGGGVRIFRFSPPGR